MRYPVKKALNEPLEWLNIAPMISGYTEELAADIRQMYADGIITRNAFIATLTPEGDPADDKGAILGERFRQAKAAIGKTDMPVGILIQATIGHGWTPSIPTPFEKIEFSHTDRQPYIMCPLGNDFRSYIRDAVRKLIAAKPDFIMVDDDFRMLTCRGGCFCPLHIARFNAEQGTNYDKAGLVAAVNSDPVVARAYDDLQKRSLVEVAAIIREAIDETDPALHCQFCICSYDMRHAKDITQAFAAKDQPLTLRINHGMYKTEGSRYFPQWLMGTMRQIQYFRNDPIRLLAEPDTCPQNRYSTSSAILHSHLVNSILSGCAGGKMWITRCGNMELDSGIHYRKTLKKYAPFYKELSRLSFEWTGAATPFPAEGVFNFPLEKNAEGSVNWCTSVLGKMGFPIYFAAADCLRDDAIVTLSAEETAHLTDPELEHILKYGRVLVDGSAAIAITERGFQDLIGVTGSRYSGKTVTREYPVTGGRICYTGHVAQIRAHEGAEILSECYHTVSGCSNAEEYIMPGCVFHKNKSGGMAAVFAAEVLDFNTGLSEAFAMLNETRKKMLADIFERFGNLGWYMPGDDEVMLRTGIFEDGSDFIFAQDLSQDDVEEFTLIGKRESVKEILMLREDGTWQNIPFRFEQGKLTMDLTLRALRPAILKIV